MTLLHPNLQNAYDRFQYIEMNLLIGFYKDLKAEFDLYDWDEKEGFYNLLAAGLPALQNARQRKALSQDENFVIGQLQTERIRVHGRYAAIRHQVAELSREVSYAEAKLEATQAQLGILRK